MVITIDGTAGSGKSTAARKLAARLEAPYLDTGAMYRVVTLIALERGVPLNDEAALARIASGDEYQLDLGPTQVRVRVCGHDVTEALRTMRVSEHTRYVARLPAVRQALVERQRRIAAQFPTIVTEGRDQGSVAFPDAEVKFYVDAAVEKRAERRYHELLADGEDVTYEQVLANLKQRDDTDSNRDVGALVVPPGAVRIDTTDLSIAEVVERMAACVARRLGRRDGAQRARGAARGVPVRRAPRGAPRRARRP